MVPRYSVWTNTEGTIIIVRGDEETTFTIDVFMLYIAEMLCCAVVISFLIYVRIWTYTGTHEKIKWYTGLHIETAPGPESGTAEPMVRVAEPCFWPFSHVVWYTSCSSEWERFCVIGKAEQTFVFWLPLGMCQKVTEGKFILLMSKYTSVL